MRPHLNRDMPRSEDPGFVIRTALVQTIFPGASPERVELLVTDKLEKVIQARSSKAGIGFADFPHFANAGKTSRT